MVHAPNAGKLLSFPPPTPVPGPVQNWSRQISETKDKLVNALVFLRVAHDEMLAGRPVKPVDELLAGVEAILSNEAKIPAYTVVAAIRIHGAVAPEPKRKLLLFFPQDRSGV